MDFAEVKTIKKLCQELNFRPSKKLGQNFLVSKKVLDKIIKAGELKRNDTILEIGPGFGILTKELLKYVDNLIVVEKDKRLVEFLRKKIYLVKPSGAKILPKVKLFDGVKNIEIINDDVLKIFKIQFPISKKNLKSKSQAKNYKIISNLPYQITSPILWKFLNEIENKPQMMVLMVQKEVAERIVAKPGQMSVLSVMCQFRAECKIVSQVSKENFWPQPEVDSAILRMTTRTNADRHAWLKRGLTRKDEKKFFKIVKIGFSAKRKMLKNNLSVGLKISSNGIEEILEKIGLNKKARAQELSVDDWIRLSAGLRRTGF